MWLLARWNGFCAEDGEPIKAGDKVFARDGKFYCEDCGKEFVLDELTTQAKIPAAKTGKKTKFRE